MLKQCINFVLIGLIALLLAACSSTPQKPVIVIEQKEIQKIPAMTEAEKADYQRGLTLLSENNLAEAESVFSLLIQKQPFLTGALVNLGIIEKQKGDLEKAEKLFQQALDINPNFIDALLQKSLLLREKGKFDETETFLRRAEAVNAEHPLVN